MINVKDGEVKVYINSNLEEYSVIDKKKIEDSFKPLNPSNEGIGMGGGASGLLPELNIVIMAGASLVAVGFLGALGEDIYRLLKKGIIEIVGIRPKKSALSLPPDYSGPIHTQLILWIRFYDERMLIVINLLDEKDLDTALSRLPSFIDELFKNGATEIGRLSWDGNKWSSII